MVTPGVLRSTTFRLVGILSALSVLSFVLIAGLTFAVVAGDVDSSGTVDAVDIQLVINAALGIGSGPACDINNDGQVNAVDVQLVINGALGIPSPNAPVVSFFSINSGMATTVSRTVVLANTCTKSPIYYMASEASDFADTDWHIYSDAPLFKLSWGIGVKTVWFKAINAAGESAVVNDSITVNEIMAGTEETIGLPGNVPLVMVWIPAGSSSLPAGTFMMGAYEGEQDAEETANPEVPQHQVTLTEGFWLGKYELTKGQWQAVMNTKPWSGISFGVLDDPDSPAVYVGWQDAQDFMTALKSYTGMMFRLPWEAEWEYACRANTTTRFYWGDDPNYTQIGDYAWNGKNTDFTEEWYGHVVGLKLPNAFNLYDMSGNVDEWCQDWYGIYPSSDAVTDPTGPSSHRHGWHVLRGGSWSDSMWCCRSAIRGAAGPPYGGGGQNNLGFRVARTP